MGRVHGSQVAHNALSMGSFWPICEATHKSACSVDPNTNAHISVTRAPEVAEVEKDIWTIDNKATMRDEMKVWLEALWSGLNIQM